MRCPHIAVLAAAALFAWAPNADAQVTPSQDGQAYEYWVPGRPAINVFAIGDVNKAGTWKIRQDVDFVELLSVIGVGSLTRPKDINTVVTTTVRIRSRQGNRRVISYEEPLDLVLAGEVVLPSLKDGDILILDTQERPRRRLTLRTVSSVVGAASSLVLLVIGPVRGRGSRSHRALPAGADRRRGPTARVGHRLD